MFDNIHFISYNIPKSLGLENVPHVKHQLMDITPEAFSKGELPPNIKNTEFSISGRIETFSNSPVSPFALKNLFHLEAFSIFTCGQDFYTKRANYNSFMILYTYEGNGRLEYEGRNYNLSSGDGFFIDCRQPQNYMTAGDYWKHSVIHLNGPLLPHIFEQYLGNGTAAFSQPLTGSYHAGLEQLLSIYSKSDIYRDWQASSCIDGILTELLIGARGTASRMKVMPENIQYLIRYMENNFTSALSLDYLADFSGFSKYYLSREFKKYTGYSPNDYLIHLRINYAKSLLLSTALPVNTIAYMTGMQNINNFINLFKKKNGMTPGEFRKKAILNK